MVVLEDKVVPLVKLPVNLREKDNLIAIARNITQQTVQVIQKIVVAGKRLSWRLLDAPGKRQYLLRRRRLEKFLRSTSAGHAGKIAPILIISKEPEKFALADRASGI